ncbi:hypothetical protein AT3G11165 [Arabidopsis thaliana]|uniref:Uncharacterized protein n=1 Tax=Arabidopsis thaliana TaxID=3702 RepID=F4J668_ARATH|nr:uncharacterized protein AT3G11165 [Arabidopsis thaliana]AEE75008.1 hypothetical protein AT3G11165 [Arabidopsis thaliana]|eukprot:NP_001154605.1 hypothetical protein AT3G11165 [Arabidopsis thaliana]
MAPNNNLRSLIALFGEKKITNKRRRRKEERTLISDDATQQQSEIHNRSGSKRAERIVYVGVEFKNFVPSVMNGFYAFCALETIQVFEYLRTMERDLRERFPEVEVQQDPLFVSSPQLPAAAADAAIYVRLVAATTCGKTQPPAVTKRTCSL